MTDETLVGGKFTIDLSDLTKKLNQANRLISASNSEFKKSTAGMDKWEESTDGLSKKIQNLNEVMYVQEQKVEALSKEYEEVKNAKGETSAEALKLEVRLNNEITALKKTESELNKYENALNDTTRKSKELETQISSLESEYKDLIKEQGKGSDEAKDLASKIQSLKGDYDALQQEIKDNAEESKNLNNVNEDTSDGFTVMKGAVAGLVSEGLKKLLSIVVENVKEIATFGIEYEKTMNRLQASTGASNVEMEKYDGIMSNLYKKNYGESVEDVGNALAIVVQNARDLDPSNIEELTKNALLLRDTFGYEVNESMRAANMLIDTFGYTSKEAFDLLTQGAQKGLDKNGDLLDTINEYSVHFHQLGFDGEEFFNMLYNGSRDGTFSIDKLGDAYKEFGIRVKDEAKATTEAYEILGLDAEKMRKEFLKGGDAAKEATKKTVDALMAVEDPVKRNTAGVGLFGTMFEDLGIEAIGTLSDVRGEFSKTSGTIDKVDETMKKGVNQTWQEMGRKIKIDVIKPMSDKLIPVFKRFLDNLNKSGALKKFTEKIVELVGKMLELGVKIMPKVIKAMGFLADNLDWLVPSIAALIVSMKVIPGIIGLITAAQKGWNLAAMANPIGLVVGGIAALTVAMVGLSEKTNEVKIEEDELSKSLEEEKQQLDEVTDSIEETTKAREDARKEQKKTTDEGLSEIGYVEDLRDELSLLVDENGNVKKGYETRVQYILGKLKDTLGIEIDMVDGVVQKYKEVQQEIDNLIEKEKAYIIWNAKKPEYEASIVNEQKNKEEWESAYNDLPDKEKNKKAADKNLEEATKVLEKTLKESGTSYNTIEKLMKNVTVGDKGKATWNNKIVGKGTFNMYKEEIQAYTTALYKSEDATNQYTKAQKNLDDATKTLTEDKKIQVDYERDAEDILNKNYDAVVKRYGAKLKATKDSTSEELASVTAYQQEIQRINRDGYAQALKDGDEFSQKKYLNLINSNAKDMQETMKYLHQQTSTIKNTSPEVIEAWKSMATNSGTEFINYLKTLPPEEAFLIKQMAGIVDSEGNILVDGWNKLASDSLSEVTGKNVEFRDAGNGMVQAVIDGEKVGKPLALQEAANLASDIASKVAAGKMDAETAGKTLLDGVNAGVSNEKKQSSILSIIGGFAGKIVGKIKSVWDSHSPSKVSKSLAEYFMDGISLGFKSKEASLINQIGGIGNEITSTLQSDLNKASANINATANLGMTNSTGTGLIANQKNGGKTVIVTQNITSPKPLNRLEIYRNTKNVATQVSLS